jgi:hypothetical protein
MEIRRHSHTAQAAYHDLVSLLLDEAVSELRGAPTLREIKGRRYWYERYRVGGRIKERYLGEDVPELRERLERHAGIGAERKARREARTRLVRLLRSERFLGLDSATGSLVSAMARAGVFRLGGVLIGTTAFRLYEGELGLRMSLDQGAATNDIDIAGFEKLSLALDDTIGSELARVFKDFNFEPQPQLERGSPWRWRQLESQTLVEFLTPSFAEEEGLRKLAAFGVSARSLHYLNFIIAEPIAAAAVYRDGILVKLPRPERYAIHKLIISDRRREGAGGAKSRKDLLQAELLAAILAEDRPADLAEAYRDAVGRGAKWQARIERSLQRSPKAAEAVERALGSSLHIG